jgi:large subunit ribosomal protein L17
MKKRVFRKRVNGKKSRSDAILRNMLLSLLSEGKVETTTSRARILKRYADREIAHAVSMPGNVVESSIERHVGSPKAAALLTSYRDFCDKQNTDITGSRVRILKTYFRKGDNAEMSELTLIDAGEFMKYLDSIKPKRKKKRAAKRMKSKKEDTGGKSEAKKEAEEKKSEKKERTPKPSKEPGVPERKEGFLNNIRGRILGRKVQGPETQGKKGRSTARSGI